MPRRRSALDRWWAELADRADGLGRSESHILLMDALGADWDEEREPSLAELRRIPVLFCPRRVGGRFGRLMEELESVGSEGPGNPWRMLSSHHSSQGHRIIKRHLDRIDRRMWEHDWPEAFTHLAILLAAVTQQDFWYADTEEPEEVENIVGKMDRRWARLRAKSSRKLGGVTVADWAVVEGVMEDLKDSMRGFEHDV